ncbi:MAG: hypothetical protein SFV54_20460 [Bryobacteraceae bacterium]|nr:hypothetical protein [Bryobacteraceae bacterium]
MKRLLLSLSLVTAAGLLWSQNGNVGQPAGPVGAQAVGRIVLDADGNGQVLCYFTVFAGLNNLFAGPRSEATARFTARSTKFKVDTVANGPAVHFRTIPAEGDAILVNFYYDVTPDQDYNQPDTFTDGQLIGTWRWSSSLGTLSPAGVTPSIGAVDLVSSNVVFHDGAPFNMRSKGTAGTAFFNIVAPPVLGPNLSLPFSAAFVVAK